MTLLNFESCEHVPNQVAVAPFGLIFDRNKAKWFDQHIYASGACFTTYFIRKISPALVTVILSNNKLHDFKDNKAFQFYSNSFTWLNSKETHLICGISKSEVKPLEKLLKSVTFYFSKLNTEGEEHKEDIDFLNLKLSNKNISEVSLINTEVEMLISVKA